ncbi:MAG TPA: right-handed parallel beta-helix repeat-containing protein [Candidatus Thermoplasmatota archaeon]|nr:right-handed parallel beta-helix repeat-containing protein [Candidatus Thermoplasmatota archaeon]
MIKADMHIQLHMHQDGMKLRKLLIVIIVMFIFANSVCFSDPFTNCKADTPPTLYVGPGETYLHIQDALNNATDGYRIFVYNGTYYENLTINHRIDLFGEDRSITIINGKGSNTVIRVNANNVNISHFTITNGSKAENTSIIQINAENSIITDNIISSGYHGIHLNNSNNHLLYDNIIRNNSGDGIRLNQSNNNVNISFNTITRNKNGIYLHSSDGNKIYNNEIQNNNGSGIFLNSTCQNNVIRYNNASHNGIHGIYLNDYSNYQTVSHNQIFSNNNSGVVLENCSMNFNINDNTIFGNINYGIMIIGSTNNISSNTISYNKKDGIYLSADDNNTVYKNTISYNTITGLRMYNSTNDYIHNNEISYNNQYGVYLDFFTINNVIFNNYFHDNTHNAMDKSINHNKWNITKTNGINIIEGTTLCGNYWDDYDEASEGATDSNLDGLADTPYTIYALNTDKGPMLDTIKPHIGTLEISPLSQTLGKYTNLSVTITDNTKIKDVYINITGSNGQRYNFSITQNKTGNTYYYNKRFSPTGNYTFYILAKDPRNWNYSVNQTFSIRPGDPPTIKDNSPSTGKPSKIFTFNATVTSKDAEASDLHVYVVWSHGNKGNNSTMAHAHGNYFVGTAVLAHSIGNLTYHFYATDKWGNHVITENKKIKIIDTERPVIHINRYGPSFEELPNSYTFGATITDDSILSTVTIEYWYDNSAKMKVNMDSIGNDYYKKVIVLTEKPERVFCIINATDIAGNSIDTKNPVAHCGGPYTGYVLEEIKFNGTRSFDLDGTITNYSWDFGDGTTGNGSTILHTYHSSGTYSVTLSVTDDQGNNGTNRTSVTIISLARHMIPSEQLNLINTRYKLTLTEQFFCYDTDGNGIADTFVDQNQVLIAVHNQPVNFNNNILFLLSIGTDSIPEFFWNTTTDLIFPVTHTIGVVQNKVVDDANGQAKLYVNVDKDQWIYIEINDQYPDSPVTITTMDRTISDDKIWRENQKIYVFDDPETSYQYIFTNIYPALTVLFSPADGGIINGDYPTIKITYNVPVTIISATFNSTNIESQLIRVDNRSFMYTPPGYLENGTHLFEIDAQALQGKGYRSASVVYFYFAYEIPPQQSYLEKNWLWIVLGIWIGAIGGILIFFKIKNVSIDGFVYIKNRKIIPFFKSVIVGPVSVQIPHEHLSKAEFYVDGQLKDEVTSFPVLWQWNEKAFLKHTLETKIYDQDGNSTSSGEMEFYIFNLFKGKQI